ncbi:MAG: hypothetical protein KAG94_05120 [Clostridiales bacterium]|nr:hypothetical protein [Clostridiales bacterium]
MKQKFDERDIIFSRLRMTKGSQYFKDYYLRYPEKKEEDKRMKEEARLRSSHDTGDVFSFLAPKADWEEKLFSQEIMPNRKIAFLQHEKYLNTPINQNIKKQDANKLTEIVKSKAMEFGACLVGIVKLTDEDYYSYKGITQFNDSYGEEINLSYKYAIVIAVEMKSEYMKKAPRYEELVATEVAYDKSVFISASLAAFLKEHGYDALTNNYINYVAPMVPLSIIAGLGEKGRNNLLVTKEYGSRVRTAAILTNATLDVDKPISFGVQEFCNQCMRCVERCPTQALAAKGDIHVSDSKCMDVWLRSRTDCGICIAVCPFSKCKIVPKLDVE